jgi:hypothetical protein
VAAGAGPAVAGYDDQCWTALVKTRVRRMQYRPSLLTGLLVGTRLDLTALQ